MNPFEISAAAIGDAPAIAAIYAHHVANGTASFDFVAPPPAFWTDKIGTLRAASWPFLVARAQDEVVGYAYATQFRDRPGYRFTCENSVYVADRAIGRGIGRALLTALLAASADAGFRTMIAVIGGGAAASVALHAALGFRSVGRLEAVGDKHDQILDVFLMQRDLCD